MKNSTENTLIAASLAPWFTVNNGKKAIKFYTAAFGAVEKYRMESPDGGMVVKLAIADAEFWLSAEKEEKEDSNTQALGGNSIRMILTVPNPDALFEQALQAGALEVFPIGEEHGWRLGTLEDPFGLHWEIGHPLL